jgi:hypothetical protein
MKMMNALIGVLVVLSGGAVVGSPVEVPAGTELRVGAWNEGSPYAGRCVVRVRTTSQFQLDRVLEIAHDVWSERIGQGPLDVDVRVADLHRLDAIGVPYDVLIGDLQAHADTHEADMLRVRREQLGQRPKGYQRGGQVHDDAWFETYRTLDEITQYCENIRALRPDLVTIESIGQGHEGWLLFSLTISGPDSIENPRDDRPVIYIFSTVHAREWIAPMTTSYIASKLTESYSTDERVRRLLDRSRVVIVPVGNPDGYRYSWSDERYWRTNRRDNGDGTFGVDINRNWGYAWGGAGSSSSTDSNTYRGTEPFSEPETRALRNAALGYGEKLIAHIDYHSYSQAVVWPFGYSRNAVTPEPAGSIFDQLAKDLVGEIEHVHDANYDALQGSDFWVAAGNSKDWLFGDLGVTSFTIELRQRGSDFNPPVDQILPCAQENYAGFVRYMERVLSPYDIWEQYRPEIIVVDDVEYTYLSFYTYLAIRVSSGLEYVHPEVVQIRAREDADAHFDVFPMDRYEESDYYSGYLPAAYCGSVVEYYYEAVDKQGRRGTQPFEGADAPFTTLVQQLLINDTDDMEQDTGWIVGHPDDTATGGIWERADPEPTEFQPGEDHTEDGTLCWITDGRAGDAPGAFDVDGGTTSLISPRFSGIGSDGFSMFFKTHFEGDWDEDHLQLYASNDDGQTWFDGGLISFSSTIAWGDDWGYFRFPFMYFINEEWEPLEPSDEMRVRFVAMDAEDDTIVEVAIDDFQLYRIGCPPSPADLNGDGELNFYDVSTFLVGFHAMDPIADFNTDGVWNFFDVSMFLKAFLDG